MKKHFKKALSIMLVAGMLLSLLPASVLAAEADSGESTVAVEPAAEENTSDVAETDPADDGSQSDASSIAGSKEDISNNAIDMQSLDSQNQGEDQNEIEAQSVTIEKTQSKPLNTDTFYRIFHLDAGRKYFSVDQIKDIIDMLAANHYTHLELAIGNDALRFVLDDMKVSVGGQTYTSDDVAKGIRNGNESYYHDVNGNALSENDMNDIISYAQKKNISVIPLLNTPGHMDAIIDCMSTLGISNPAYNSSKRTVDVTNETAVAFTLALANKYIQYFADKGCTIFNMGCDEYANDVTNGFSDLQESKKYGAFIDYVNNMAAQVQNAGMTPMAFNDGIYYNNITNSGTFDTNIAIAYWTPGWSGYSPRSAANLVNDGFKIINTNDAWYYVLGRTSGSYTLSSARSGVQKISCVSVAGSGGVVPVGSMLCLWCDTPSVEYSTAEKNNVQELIQTLSASNPTYFKSAGGEEKTNAPEVTENKTINVSVGATTKDTISGANYAGTYATDDPSIATVEVTGTDGSVATATYSSAGQVKCGSLLNEDSSDWTLTSYYYKVGDNYFPLYVKRSTSSGDWGSKIYSYTYGYSADNGKNITQIGEQSYTVNFWASDNTYINIYLYKQSGSEAVPASTTVTFTGKAVGTTYVTVGNTRYTIEVLAEDLTTVKPLQVEWWITNYPIESTDSNHSADGSYNANGKTTYYTELSAATAYGENGISLGSAVPSTGTYVYAGAEGCVYWKGTRLDSNSKQTGASGSDSTASGDDFTFIRYYNGTWAFSGDRVNWTSILSTDQIVAYYLQATAVTKEVTTMTKDWGLNVGDRDGSDNQVALSVAVVYPDGTLSPAESEIYGTSTLIYNYWNNRDIGIVAPQISEDYDVEKITVTAGSRTRGSGIFTTSDGIDWEKTTNAAGTEWFDETTYWDESVGGTPMVNGAISNITWPSANSAYLVLIYLKPVHHESNLMVRWIDDSANGVLITSQEVVVDYTGSEAVTFYNGLKQTSDLPEKGVGGTFTLDDDAYITNSSNVNQTFNKDLTFMSNIAGQYTSGLYKYTRADISADGKTLTLHYELETNVVYDPVYVVDFGLPMEFPLSDLINDTTKVKSVTVTNNAVYDSSNKKFTYTPSQALAGIEPITVRVVYNDNTSISRNVGIYPATTVYYEEGFASYMGSWTPGSKGTSLQATEKVVYGSEKYTSHKINNYGYDGKYATETAGPSNNTQASTATKGDTAEFTFTGTGVDVYANCATASGTFLIQIKNSKGVTKKILTAHTVTDGSYGALVGDQSYNTVIASVEGLYYDTYTMKLTSTDEGKVVNLDGFRVYGALEDMKNNIYTADLEDNPAYIELRDLTLTALGAEKGETPDQVYKKTEGNVTDATVVYDSSAYTQDDLATLLADGPKNELFLQQGQSLVINVATNRKVQIGMKAINNTVTVSGSYNGTLKSSTDMFYTVNPSENSTITITNNNGSAGILSVTKLKICDDPNVALGKLTADDLTDALVSLGITESGNPEEPEPTYADASLTVWVNDATTVLTKNGVVGETAIFTADEIKEAAESIVMDGYVLDEAAYTDVEVVYGESDTVSFTASEDVVEPEPTNIFKQIIKSVIGFIGKIFGYR